MYKYPINGLFYSIVGVKSGPVDDIRKLSTLINIKAATEMKYNCVDAS